MAFLTPGILCKLLDNIGSDARVAGAHRAAFLQVVGIVPAISGSDHLCPRHGFYIKVSDSSHSTYMSLEEEHADLILSNKLQVGQLIQVERLDAGSPVPILRGVQTVPGKHSFIGQPEELNLSNTDNFFHDFDPANRFGTAKELSKSNNPSTSCQFSIPSEVSADRRCSLGGTDVRVKIDKPAEKNPFRKGPELSSSPVFTSPRNKLATGRRCAERASWAMAGAPLSDKEDSQPGRPGRTKVIPEFSPTLHSRSVSASPARHQSVRSSLVFEKDGVPGGDISRAAAKGSPDVRKSFQKVPVSSAVEALPRCRQVSPALKRASSVGKAAQRLSAEEAKINTNPLRKSVSKGRIGDSLSMRTSSDEKASQRSSEDVADGNSAVCENNNLVGRAGNRLKQMRDAKTGSGIPGLSCQADENLTVSFPQSSTDVLGAKTAKLETRSDIMPELLSANLLALGKKALQRQLVASIAASEALQEASATQNILQCLSDFAELCTAARPESPGPIVDKFFFFYNMLVDATNNACALAESRLSKGPENKHKGNPSSKKLPQISAEKGQAALSWVNAALSSGLTACPWGSKDQKPLKSPSRQGFDGKCCKNKMNPFSSPARAFVTRPPSCPTASASPTSTNCVPNRAFMSSPPFRALGDDHNCKGSEMPSYACQLETTRMNDRKQIFPAANVLGSEDTFMSLEKRADALLQWVKGSEFAEAASLAKQLQAEAEAWFVRFVESALDSGYKIAIKEATAMKRIRNASSPWPDDDNQVSAVLSDLKRVNEWLDEMSSEKWAFSNSGLEETTAKLKQKLYDLLIQLVLQSPSQTISHSLCS